MTMTDVSADDDDLAGVFSSEREDRGGKEPASEPTPVETGQPRGERGRFVAKPSEEQQPPVDQQQAAQLEQQQSPPDPNANRLVPLNELKSERSKRQEEARLRAEAETRARVYEQQIQQLMQQPRHVQPPQPQQQIEPPDPIADPEGYFRHIQKQFDDRLLDRTLHLSEAAARRHFGNQVVDEAFQAAQRSGVTGQFLHAPDPYGALVEWHKRETALAKYGADPEAYEKQLEQKIRQQVLEELKAGGAQGQQPQRFPGTLANATATGVQGAVITDEAMMGDVYGSDRRNRGR